MPDDHRAQILNLLADYSLRFTDEEVMVSRYLRFVEDNEDCFERTLSIGHVTGSALILDSACERVLLTHHKKLDRWLQPGGHADGVSDVAAVAMQEAEEESGLSAIEFLSDQLLDVDIHTIPERKSEPAHEHFDCRFLLRSTGPDTFEVSDESHDLAWVPMNRITDYTDDDSILRMIRKAKQLV